MLTPNLNTSAARLVSSAIRQIGKEPTRLAVQAAIRSSVVSFERNLQEDLQYETVRWVRIRRKFNEFTAEPFGGVFTYQESSETPTALIQGKEEIIVKMVVSCLPNGKFSPAGQCMVDLIRKLTLRAANRLAEL